MELVTVVNRSSKPVRGTWDGKPEIIAPHAKSALPIIVAEAIKDQNVIMGSEDPITGDMQYLVGIVEYGDDISNTEQSNAVTRMNRSARVGMEDVVKAQFPLRSRNEVAQTIPGPESGQFERD